LENILHRSFDDTEALAIKAACVGVIFIVNMRNFSDVGIFSICLGVLGILPFIVQPILSWKEMNFDNIKQTAEPVQMGLFISTLLWNFSGWDYLGCFAGEVVSPSKSYARGIFGTIILIWFAYLIPIIVGASLDSNWSQWEEGYLITIASNTNRYLGYCVGLSAIIGVFGSLNAMVSTMARAVWRMGKYGTLPSFCCIESAGSTDGHMPIVAVSIKCSLSLLLAAFNGYNTLVELDMFFNCLGLILEFASFLYLKVTNPQMSRPFAVPGGVFGAILISIPKVIIITMNLASSSRNTWLVCGTMTLATAIVYPFWVRGYLSSIIPGWEPAPADLSISDAGSDSEKAVLVKVQK